MGNIHYFLWLKSKFSEHALIITAVFWEEGWGTKERGRRRKIKDRLMSCLMSASEGWTNEVKTQPSLFHHLLHSAHSLPEVMVRKKNSRIEENWDWWKEEWQHILITLLPAGFLSLIFYLSFFLMCVVRDVEGQIGTGDRQGDREEKQEVLNTTPWPPGSLGLRWCPH